MTEIAGQHPDELHVSRLLDKKAGVEGGGGWGRDVGLSQGKRTRGGTHNEMTGHVEGAGQGFVCGGRGRSG